MAPWQLVLTIVLSHYSANLVAFLVVKFVIDWTKKPGEGGDHEVDDPPLYEPSPALLRYCAEKNICPECARPLSDHAKPS